MHPSSQKAIVAAIEGLTSNAKVSGVVRITGNVNRTRIDITYDNRKYIGRLRLELQGDKYLVYMMDKAEGKIAASDTHSSKSAYLEIKNVAEARLFVKWFILLTQLVALKRNRS